MRTPLQQLNGIDSFFVYLDSPHGGMHGQFLQTYAPAKGQTAAARYRALVRHVRACLPASRVFHRVIRRRPLDLDHAYWVEDVDVDLGHHIRRRRLPAPGNWEQLARTYADIYAQRMDLARPLWEIHVIDGVNAVDWAPRHSFALVVKFHHAGVDGVSATEIATALHSPIDSQAIRQPPRPDHPSPPPVLPHAPLRSLRLTARLVQSLRRMKPNVSPPAALSVPRALFNAPISRRRSYTSERFSLATVKNIRDAVPGATVNDIYLATCGGALRRYLQHHRALPARSLVAAVPVNVRASTEQGLAGNQFATVRVPLHTEENDPLRRLQRVAAAARAAKDRLSATGARRNADLAKDLPAPLLYLLGSTLTRTRLVARVPPQVNLIVSNVPGPREPLYLNGARLLDINGVPPIMDGLGLIIATTSYCDNLQVAVGGCRELLPDPEFLRRCLRESFAALSAAASLS